MSRSNEIDPKKVTAAGKGVDVGVTGEQCRFQIHNLKGKIELLSMTIDGPSVPKINSEVDDDGNINCDYTPPVAGDYVVSIKVNDKGVDKHIKGSPFKVKVIGDSDPRLERIKKIETSGKGLAIGKSFQQNEYWIDGRAAHLGGASLAIAVKNPERASTQLKINDMGDGTFKVQYKPTASGCYVFNIKVESIHIPGSPFYVRVT